MQFNSNMALKFGTFFSAHPVYHIYAQHLEHIPITMVPDRKYPAPWRQYLTRSGSCRQYSAHTGSRRQCPTGHRPRFPTASIRLGVVCPPTSLQNHQCLGADSADSLSSLHRTADSQEHRSRMTMNCANIFSLSFYACSGKWYLILFLLHIGVDC